MELTKQYFDKRDLLEISKQIKLNSLMIQSNDTYSDLEVWESILATGKQDLLLCSAIQMCVAGFGNKTYGTFVYEDKLYDVKDLFNTLNVKTELGLQSKIRPDELTPKRIQRIFRQQVHEFIDKNDNLRPYLWRKYSTRDVKYRSSVFPNAEHLLEDEGAINYLIQTYQELDRRNNTYITDKIIRVFEARGFSKLISRM